MPNRQLSESLTIRLLNSYEDLLAVKELEEMIWASDDPVPLHQTMTAVKHGGMVIGAFVGEHLIGFQYSFAGFDGEKAYLCSHTMGIHPEYQKSGVGEKIKRTQQKAAIEKGYDLVLWTYDPLETVNGNLNIRKLGATCTTYIQNCYGEMTDILNAGIPSDRFQVEWWIKRPNVIDILTNPRKRSEMDGFAKPVLHLEINPQGDPEPQSIDLTQEQYEGQLVVAVPAAFQEVKERNFDLALRWRMATRGVFKHYFQNGWLVSDFIKSDRAEPVHYYVMEKANEKRFQTRHFS
ncbi:GNAT family N-acetyltransferase [Brevibacillus reuszeri]|uniref:GNAT family N-acetyltransferase n=1 Tax=Brevibacillus reuszeri TaxID=54915 RepID=UPI002897A0BB|nr:GNAT family N-acetyltransferase [Brevibacillus reuszeri]